MKSEDVEDILKNIQLPKPEERMQHHEMKIPLMSYRKSSRAGLWLLLLPLAFAVAVILKEFGVQSGYLALARKFFASIENHVVLTYLIPLFFIGLPLIAMIINFLAICHFQNNRKTKELIITVKQRPLNIIIFLVSLAVLVFFLLPDKLAF